MANQHIQFQIGSAFSGEGFKQAQAATGRLKAGVNQGAAAVGQLATAMGGMDGKVGAAARAMTGMLSTFMSMNPVIIGITAAITALTLAFNHYKEKQEAAKKAAEEFIKTQQKLLEKVNTSIVERAASDMKELGKDFDRITKHAKDMAAALSSLSKERSQGGIISIQAEKVKAVFAEVEQETRQLIAAEYDLKIATQKEANVRAAGEAEVRAAHQAFVDGENKLANINEQRAEVAKQIKHLENNIAYSKAKKLETDEADAKKLKQLSDMMLQLSDDEIATKEAMSVAMVKEKTASEKLANALAQAEIDTATASGSLADLKRAAEEAAAAERKAAAAEFVRAHEMEQQRDLQKEAADIQNDVNKAAQDVAQAERDYAKALAEFEKNYADNVMSNDILNNEDHSRKMAIPVKISGRVMADVQARDLENAIQNGVVRNVRDMDKFIRENARKRAAEETKQWNQLKVERQRYERLRQQSRKTWSKADADFVEKFEKLKAAADAKVQEVKDAKQRLADAKRREEENNENLKKIKNRLEKLGLK